MRVGAGTAARGRDAGRTMSLPARNVQATLRLLGRVRLRTTRRAGRGQQCSESGGFTGICPALRMGWPSGCRGRRGGYKDCYGRCWWPASTYDLFCIPCSCL